MTSTYAEMSSALDLVPASLSIAPGEGKTQEKGRLAWAQLPFVLRSLPHWRRALRSSVVDILIMCELPLSMVNLVLMTSTFAEMSSALGLVSASLSIAPGGGKLRRREGSHGRSFHLG